MTVFKTCFKLIKSYKVTIISYLLFFLFISFMIANSVLSENTKEENSDFKKYKIAIKLSKKTDINTERINILKKHYKVTVSEKSIQDLKEDLIEDRYIFVVVLDDEARFLTPISMGMYSLNARYILESEMRMKNMTSGMKNSNELLEKVKNINLKSRHLKNDSKSDIKTRVFFSKYFISSAYILLSIISIISFLIFNEFFNKEIRIRNIIAKKKIWKINIQVFLAVLSFIVVLISTIALSSLFLIKELMINKEFFLYIAMQIVLAVSIVSLIFMASVFFRKKEAVSGISNIISLGLSFTSGVLIPMEVMSDKVIMISNFFPVIHYVRACNKIFDDKLPLSEAGIILSYALLYISISLFFSKYKSKKLL